MKHIIILTTLILFSALLNAEENKNIDLIVKENSTSIIGEWGIGIGASWKSSANKGGHHIGTSTVCFWDTSNKIYDVSGFKWKVQ